MAKRNVEYYFLEFKINGQPVDILRPFKIVTSFITSLENINRKLDYPTERFCFLDVCEQYSNEKIFKVLFKSAKHSYRAPLLDKNTVEARDNPKTLNEGEQVKTHLVINCSEDTIASIFLERAINLLSMKQITMYLNHFLMFYNSQNDDKIEGLFEFSECVRDDFNEVLESMRELKTAEITIDKSLLGSDALNYSNQIESIDKDLYLTLRAKRKRSLDTRIIYEILARMNSSDNRIKRIRIKGRMEDGNEGVISTDMFKKKESVDVSQNSETGEYNTDMMFDSLRHLSNDDIY